MDIVLRWCSERDALDIIQGKDFGGTQEDWQAAFKALDTDNSGKVSVQEIRDAQLIQPGALYKYMSKHDIDNEGEINFDEFLECVSALKGDCNDAQKGISGELANDLNTMLARSMANKKAKIPANSVYKQCLQAGSKGSAGAVDVVTTHTTANPFSRLPSQLSP